MRSRTLSDIEHGEHESQHVHGVTRACRSLFGCARAVVDYLWRRRRPLSLLLASLPIFAFAQYAAYALRYEWFLVADT